MVCGHQRTVPYRAFPHESCSYPGYGVTLAPGLITPYAAFSLGDDGHVARYGARWAFAETAHLDIGVTDQETAATDAPALIVRFSARW